MGLQKWLYERDLKRRIAKNGYALVHVSGGEDGPPFSYTVGLALGIGDGELIVSGLAPRAAKETLRHAVLCLRAGRLQLSDGATWDDRSDGPKCVVRAVHPTHIRPKRFASALWWRSLRPHADALTAFQIVGPDAAGLLPWDESCDFGLRMDQEPLYEPYDEAAPNALYEKIEAEWEAAGQPAVA
jgi:hypothetical protein